MITNAAKIAALFRSRAQNLERALRRAWRKIGIEIDRKQADNLRGGEAPGDYPVPVRTGDLLRERFFDARRADYLIVGNKSAHAVSVHKGLGPNTPYDPREFLTDAINDVPALEILRNEIKTAWAI